MTTGFTTGITIITQGLPDAIVSAVYDSYTMDALDYTAPISWAIVAGALPAGMVMNAGGVVSGTPTAVGTFTFTVEATDATLATKQKVLTIRVAPDLGNVRRHQQETIVEKGTSVVPIEGATGTAALRRKLERLLARLDGSQIQAPYMLDAVDLQVRNFDAIPLQSIDDALNYLLGLIGNAAYGLDANGAGAPFVTPGGSGELNVQGLGSITVAKNIGLNRLEISFTGAALSAPFTMLPAPSGDMTGATDTAAIAAILAGAPQGWLISPQDETSLPYYINADLGNPAGTRRFRITGKSRDAFRINAVGGLRTWWEVDSLEHATVSRMRFGPSSITYVARYYDCVIILDANDILFDVDVPYGHMWQCSVVFSAANVHVFDGAAGAIQLHAVDCAFAQQVAAPTGFLFRTDATIPDTQITLQGCHMECSDGVGLDMTSIPATAIIALGTNRWRATGTGTAIVRGSAPGILNGRYAESPQVITDLATAHYPRL